MGLKIHRIARSPGNSVESSTLISARYEYELTINDVSGQEINVEVRDFADQHQQLDDEAVKRLFDHIWKQATATRQLNIVIDLFEIRALSARFEREFGYLRRQLRSQRRSARLSNVSMGIPLR